jgi:hypothetical protein
MEAEEEDEDGIFHVSALTGKEEEEEGERGSWWTPDPSWLESEAEEETEEEILYLNGVTSGEYSKAKGAGR